MKRSLLVGLILIVMLNFVSAYNGYYGGFSLSDFLSEIDEDTMLLGAIFIISFAILNFSLSKFFKDKHDEPNTKVSGVISFVIALFIVWGINKSGVSFGGFLYDLGIPLDFLTAVLPLIILGAFIFMGLKWGIGKSLVFIGGFFIAATFFVYEKGLMILLAVLFIIGGGIVWHFWPKKVKPKYNHYPWSP